MPIIYAMRLGSFEVDYETIKLLNSSSPAIRNEVSLAILQELKYENVNAYEVRVTENAACRIEVWSREIRTGGV